LIEVVSIVLNNFTNDSRVLKENISLKNAGYDVQVVGLHQEPLDEFDEVQGISVHRVKLSTMNWSKNLLASFVKYMEWTYKIVKTYKSSDIIHCNDLNTLHIGVISKLFNKKLKVVYDAHEYETEIDGLSGIRKKLSKLSEKFLIRYADRVITVSNAIADEYVKLYDIEKPLLVLNTPPYKTIEKKNIFRETLNIDEDKIIFLYQGGLSGGRGIEILVDAFKMIDNKDAVIVFMGYGSLEKMIVDASEEYENIYFHKAVSPEVLLDYTCSADFGILFYENSCLNHYYCSPNKMFEYLMAEIPVIVSNLYEMKRLVETKEIGVVAEENSANGLKEAIEKAVQLDSKVLEKKIEEVKSIYNWEEQEKILIDVYRGLYE